jgi:ribonuclease P protein component
VQTLSKYVVIKKNEDFQSIFEKGHSIYGRYLVVYFLHTSYDVVRYGFCVGRKIGNAVIRNRIKRLLREAVSATVVPELEGRDILLIARNSIYTASLSDIISEITHILGKVKKIRNTSPVSNGFEREGSH